MIRRYTTAVERRKHDVYGECPVEDRDDQVMIAEEQNEIFGDIVRTMSKSKRVLVHNGAANQQDNDKKGGESD